MAVTIVNVDSTHFSIDGIKYLKNYQSVVIGDKVEISNVYDSKDIRVNKTIFSDFTVNAVAYGSASLLQIALVDVIYKRYSLSVENGYNLINNLSEFDASIAASTAGIWLILSDITLDVNKVLPANVTLRFRNAKINGGGFSLTGTDTKIESGLNQIFDTNITTLGTWEIPYSTPEWFGGGINVVDNSPFIASSLLLSSNLFLSVFGVYKKTLPIHMKLGYKVFGLNRYLNYLEQSDNTQNCFEFDTHCDYTDISNLTLEGVAVGTGSCFYLDQIGGANDQKYSNLIINNFKNGFDVGEIWWENNINNIRINTCTKGISITAPGGQSIQNNFSNIAINNCTSNGIYLSGTKGTTFRGLNIGSNANIIGAYMYLTTNSITTSVISGNFENSGTLSYNIANQCSIASYSSSTLSLKGCTFTSNNGINDTYEVRAFDASKVTCEDVHFINQGISGIKNFGVSSTASLTLINMEPGSIVNTSTNPTIITNDIKTVGVLNGYNKIIDAGETTLSAGFVATGVTDGTVNYKIIVNVIGSLDVLPTVKCFVTDRFSTGGSFKVRFANVSDGLENFGSFTIDWLLIKI